MTIVEWYESVCKDSSFNDIQTLMQKRGLLSAASVKMAKSIKDKLSELRRIEFSTKLDIKRHAIFMQGNIDEATNKHFTVAKATSIAEIKFSDEMVKACTLESEIDGDKMILRQINHVLEAMRQDIAEMRGLREGK